MVVCERPRRRVRARRGVSPLQERGSAVSGLSSLFSCSHTTTPTLGGTGLGLASARAATRDARAAARGLREKREPTRACESGCG